MDAKYKALRKQGYKCKHCGASIRTSFIPFYKYSKQGLAKLISTVDLRILDKYTENEIAFWIYDKLWENWIECLCLKCGLKKVFSLLSNTISYKEAQKDLDKILEILQAQESGLGANTNYISTYTPSLLYSINRGPVRKSIGYNVDAFPLEGVDIWNAYEFSTLTSTGKPTTSQIRIIYDSTSESIVESKSLKLYLNSFNQSVPADFVKIISNDLKHALRAPRVDVLLNPPDLSIIQKPLKSYFNLDKLDTRDFVYTYTGSIPVELSPYKSSVRKPPVQKFVTRSFKSNCRFSGLPDWAVAYIEYLPKEKIVKPEDLHRYLVSYRNHQEFHEECCERISYDLIRSLDPVWLRVRLFYTRRGGIDINPIRIYDPYGKYKYDRKKEIQQYKRQIFQ